MLYIRYEYIEKGCFNLECYVSEVIVSGTKMVKFDFVVSVILIICSLVHLIRILYFVSSYKWFDFQGELDQSRVNYVKEHPRLMSSGFGRGYDFEMKRLR